ncbi:MAG TPA: peptidoglycan-binding protein [Acidimicrobiales bacterium]|nr:peptidoglycan-binding protein [Acidimicrobiales bacterium]
MRAGDRGEAVRDLQHRLGGLGHPTTGDEPGVFAGSTEAAVRAFQLRRGLRVDGICGAQTWAALVEAGWRLGDRLLYLRQPMLRGDDVAALQSRLGALGFDAGRVDGIFGPDTKRALDEFQRNIGIVVDGVCGSATIAMFERFGPRGAEREPVAAVRELEMLRRSPRTLQGRRVVLGDGGGMHAALSATERVLTQAGAEVIVARHPDQSDQAAEANAAGGDVFLGLRLEPAGDGCASSHYAGHRYESPGGRRLAELVQSVVPDAVGIGNLGVRGMAIPVLKETRMPAVVCELGPPSCVVAHTAELARALGTVLAAWVRFPVDEPAPARPDR